MRAKPCKDEKESWTGDTIGGRGDGTRLCGGGISLVSSAMVGKRDNVNLAPSDQPRGNPRSINLRPRLCKEFKVIIVHLFLRPMMNARINPQQN